MDIDHFAFFGPQDPVLSFEDSRLVLENSESLFLSQICFQLSENEVSGGEEKRIFLEKEEAKQEHPLQKLKLRKSLWTQSENYAFFIHLGKFYLQNLQFQNGYQEILPQGFFSHMSDSLKTKSRVQCKNKYQWIKSTKKHKCIGQDKYKMDIDVKMESRKSVLDETLEYLSLRSQREAIQIVDNLEKLKSTWTQIKQASKMEIRQMREQMEELDKMQFRINEGAKPELNFD